MRLCTFSRPGENEDAQRVGIVEGSKVFDLTTRIDMMSFLRQSVPLSSLSRKGEGHKIAEVVLSAPIRRPGKILATIVNTQGMLGGTDVRLDRPRIDMKAPSAVIGPGATILAPAYGIRPEVELAAIIGRRLERVSEAVADKGIFGYTVLNDVTAPKDSREDAYEAYRRDRVSGAIRKATMRGPLFRSKNHDTFCPMGPWIATPQENGDWANLRMTTKFAGRLVQDGSTSEYLFSPKQIISYVSGFLTLEPGDVVSCGSVGWTKDAIADLDPTEFVLPQQSGNLELEVEGLGSLSNPVKIA
ncbi:MAG: fumarylacetoacetate hydrolase family protein [Thaumarchaeota archaeon]|nr:fumarylacetoacetate hydrolase family protein [Nitrososphaerota archaeon]